MILFDRKKILRVAKRDPKRVLNAIRVLSGEVPKNKYDPLYFFYQKDFSGKSFLVNPKELLENDYFYPAKHMAEYVLVASYRNYAHYCATGDTTLDLLHCPVQQSIITNNRLLSIKNGRILFEYEEVTKEKSKWL